MIYTSSTERKGRLNIVTDDLVSTIESESLDSNHSVTIKSGESKGIIVIIFKNDNGQDVKYNFYYGVEEGVNINYDSTRITKSVYYGNNLWNL